MNINYGEAPQDLGFVDIECPEMMFNLYLPIKMKNSDEFRIPENMKFIQPLLEEIEDIISDNYVYLTVKKMYVNNTCRGNREGWHSDGFQTDDINYIWYDSRPTQFAIQSFDISDDCEKSLKEFRRQFSGTITSYDCKSLLRLTQRNIHRVSMNDFDEGIRTFVKVSISKNKYNLADNSHNHLFDYKWDMKCRQTERNHPCKDFENA